MNTDDSLPVVVIGAGLGGLAAACTLAARGHRVVLCESNAWLGGKAAVLEERGFRFDMGPTILTLPSVLGRIFGEADRRLEDALDLIPLDPQWRSFFDDGRTLDLVADTERMAERIDAFTGGAESGEGYRRFMALSARQDEISRRWFFWKPIGGLRDMFDPRTLFDVSSLRDVLAMRMGGTVAGTLRSHVRDARVAQMLDHFTQYVGSAPDQSPAVLCSIAHMQTGEGVWYPRGGTGAVPAALRKLAEELGVDVREQCSIARIVVESGRVGAVETTDGERIACRAVVSNRDVARTYRELLRRQDAPGFEKRRRYEPACSGVVLYLGLRKAYEHLLHHNFVFSADPHEEFDTIYREGEPAPDPTCYVCAPARTDDTAAPRGGEALYVLVHTPYLRPHHDWKEMFPAYRRRIVDKLARTAGLEDLEERIIFEQALTPQGIHDRYQVLNGAIYGLASHGRFFGAFKPGNRSPDVRGLYLAGGSAHPGPGMPMALMSGWIAGDALHADAGAGRTEALAPLAR
jgi:diapolycopene oxygenase